MKRLFLLFFIALQLYAKADPDELINRANLYQKRALYPKALELYSQYIKEYPFEYRIREAYFQTARIYHEQKEYRTAIQNYRILRSRYPHYPQTQETDYWLGDAYYYTGNYTRSIFHLRDYSEKYPKGSYRGQALRLQLLIHRDLREYGQEAELLEYLLDSEKNMKRTESREFHYRLVALYYKELNNTPRAYDHLMAYYNLGGTNQGYNELLERKITINHFKQSDGLRDPSIADIEIDGDDIYIATFNGGLYRFVRSREVIEYLNIPSPNIRDISIDHDYIYISTFDGVFLYNKKTSQTESLMADGGLLQLAQKVVKDDRYLYFSTLTKGVARLDIVDKEMKTFSFNSFLGTNQVYALASSPRYVAFGTLDHGAIIQDKEKNKTYRINEDMGLTGDNVKTILIDGRFIWLGVHGKGIFRFDPETETLHKYHWDIHYPASMAIREEEIYIGTTGNGLWIFNRSTGNIQHLDAMQGLASNDIQHIEVEGDYVWLGYLEKGIDVLYRPQKNRP